METNRYSIFIGVQLNLDPDKFEGPGWYLASYLPGNNIEATLLSNDAALEYVRFLYTGDEESQDKLSAIVQSGNNLIQQSLIRQIDTLQKRLQDNANQPTQVDE